MTVTWKVYVDWDRDGITSADDITSDVLSASWGLGFADPLELVAGESQLELELRNADSKYSPENSSGTYYGKFDPHTRVRIDSISTLGTITHWHGWLKSVLPDSNLDTPYARLMASDSTPYLERNKVNYKLYQNVTADEVIRDIITETREWSPSMAPGFVLGQTLLGSGLLANEEDSFDFDTGLSQFTYAGDTWDDNTTAMRAIAELVRGENGYFFYSRGGSATFYARDAFANLGRTNIGTVTYTDYQDITYSYGDNIINEVTMRIAPRTLDSSESLIYDLPESGYFELKALQEKTIRCRYELQDDETAIASIPEDCRIEIGWTPNSTLVNYTVEFTARHAVVTIRNDAYTIGTSVTINKMQVFGPNITRKNTNDITARDNESVGKYGLRQLVIDAPLFEDEAAASVIVNRLLVKRKDPRGDVHSINFRTKPDETNLSTMLQWTVGTRFELDDAPTSHNASYFVIGESHTLQPGQLHDVTYYLKSAADENYFLLGTSILGGDDVLFT